MRILAVDPGTTQTAWLVYDSEARAVLGHYRGPNERVLATFRSGARGIDAAAIEKIESYGMPVGAEVFDTVHWSGRFTEALHPLPVHPVTRRAVKLHLCGSARAKDPNVRRALLDLFGGDRAQGTKARPGPLHGITVDRWAALGVAVTFAESPPAPEEAA